MPIRFGPCMLDADRHELRRDGALAHLSPHAFELLALLVAHRPRALSKEELLDRLWPSRIVTEANEARQGMQPARRVGSGRGEIFERAQHLFAGAEFERVERQLEVQKLGGKRARHRAFGNAPAQIAAEALDLALKLAVLIVLAVPEVFKERRELLTERAAGVIEQRIDRGDAVGAIERAIGRHAGLPHGLHQPGALAFGKLVMRQHAVGRGAQLAAQARGGDQIAQRLLECSDAHCDR